MALQQGGGPPPERAWQLAGWQGESLDPRAAPIPPWLTLLVAPMRAGGGRARTSWSGRAAMPWWCGLIRSRTWTVGAYFRLLVNQVSKIRKVLLERASLGCPQGYHTCYAATGRLQLAAAGTRCAVRAQHAAAGASSQVRLLHSVTPIPSALRTHASAYPPLLLQRRSTSWAAASGGCSGWTDPTSPVLTQRAQRRAAAVRAAGQRPAGARRPGAAPAGAGTAGRGRQWRRARCGRPRSSRQRSRRRRLAGAGGW